MERKKIADLLESLCEHPLADGGTQRLPELEAFRCEVAKALSRSGDPRPDAADSADADRLTAALAALLSGVDAEAARLTLQDAMLRSAEARLDAQSAFAFLDAIERSPQAAPAHLVDEVLAADTAGTVRSAVPGARTTNLLSLIVGSSWSARRWRMAAACAMLLLVAGIASVQRQQTNPAVEGSPAWPAAKRADEQPAGAPAPPKSELVTAQPCEQRPSAGKAVAAESIAPAAEPMPANAPVAADCMPAADREFADHPAGEIEAIAARGQAEAARQAAAAREAAKIGAAQAGSAPYDGPIQADRSGPLFGAAGRNVPAAAAPPPAVSLPAVRPAAPARAR